MFVGIIVGFIDGGGIVCVVGILVDKVMRVRVVFVVVVCRLGWFSGEVM